MKKINDGVASTSVICPIIRDMRRNKCDYPELRGRLSPRTKERCACAGENGKQCVLRCIRVGNVNIVQRYLYHQEFRSRGDRDPTIEIQQAIQAYEKQMTLISRFVRWIKSTFAPPGKLFSYAKFHGSIRSASH